MSVCLFLNPLKMSEVRGWRGEEGGCGVGGGRSWPPPVARAGSRCPGLEGVLWWCCRGGGEGEPCAHRATYLKPCWFQAWP